MKSSAFIAQGKHMHFSIHHFNSIADGILVSFVNLHIFSTTLDEPPLEFENKFRHAISSWTYKRKLGTKCSISSNNDGI